MLLLAIGVFLRGQAGALKEHRDDDTRRFEQVLARLDTLRQESADRAHAMRDDFSAKISSQEVVNMRLVSEVAEIRGELKGYAAVTAAAVAATTKGE